MIAFFRKHWNLTILIIFYVFSFGLIPFTVGIFWDDWTLVDVKKSALITIYQQMGLPGLRYIHALLLPLGGLPILLVYKLLIFMSYLFAAFFLNSILKTIKEIRLIERLFIVIIFAILPVNFGRIAMIDIPYALSYGLFFQGLWFLSIYFKNRNLWLRFISLCLLLVSFATNSLLFYYLIVIAYIIYIERVHLKKLVSSAKVAIKYLDYLLLPVFYWVIKGSFFVPSGIYTGYNKIDSSKFLLSYQKIIDGFDTCFWDVLRNSFLSLHTYPIIVLFGSFIVFIFLSKTIKVFEPDNKHDCAREILRQIRFILLGLVLLWLAIFPYYAAGAEPTVTDWTSRNQLLIPLGASFLIYFGISLLSNCIRIIFELANTDKIKLFIISLILTLFTLENFSVYLSFQKDWLKQLSLIENFRTNEDVKNNTTFAIFDNTTELNSINRRYRFYEYAGQFKTAFGDESRLGEDAQLMAQPEYYSRFHAYPEYNISNYIPKEPEYTIVISAGSFKLSNLNMVKLLYYKFIDKNKYEENIKNIVQVKTAKITQNSGLRN
jgi:hypothetical protein